MARKLKMMKSFRITNKMLSEGISESLELSPKAKAYYNGNESLSIIVLHPDSEYFPMYGLTTALFRNTLIATPENTEIFDSFFDLEATLEEWADN